MTLYQTISLFLMLTCTGWLLIRMRYKEPVYFWKFTIVVVSIVNFIISMVGFKQ